MGGRFNIRRIGLVLGVLALALASGLAQADYQGPDENASQAYGPLKGAHTYSAMLNNDGSHPDDQDWYYFYVPAAGDQLRFTVKNSSSGCAPQPQPYYCHVYATLEDSSGKQVGGSNSSAGTAGALPGQTQYINWTFSFPGKYYIAFVGDGDQLNYQFSVTPAGGVTSTPPGSGGGGGQQALRLRDHQHGRDVVISVVVPSPGARLKASLYRGSGPTRRLAGRLDRVDLPKGSFHHAIRLRSWAWSALKKRHRLTLHLLVTVRSSSGPALHASRKLVVKRPA